MGRPAAQVRIPTMWWCATCCQPDNQCWCKHQANDGPPNTRQLDALTTSIEFYIDLYNNGLPLSKPYWLNRFYETWDQVFAMMDLNAMSRNKELWP